MNPKPKHGKEGVRDLEKQGQNYTQDMWAISYHTTKSLMHSRSWEPTSQASKNVILLVRTLP